MVDYQSTINAAQGNYGALNYAGLANYYQNAQAASPFTYNSDGTTTLKSGWSFKPVSGAQINDNYGTGATSPPVGHFINDATGATYNDASGNPYLLTQGGVDAGWLNSLPSYDYSKSGENAVNLAILAMAGGSAAGLAAGGGAAAGGLGGVSGAGVGAPVASTAPTGAIGAGAGGIGAEGVGATAGQGMAATTGGMSGIGAEGVGATAAKTAASGLSQFIPSIISGVTGIIGAKDQSNAAQNATDAQLKATEEGLSYARETRDLALKLNQPFYDASVGALGRLQQMAGLSPTGTPTTATSMAGNGYNANVERTGMGNGETTVSSPSPSGGTIPGFDITQDPSYQFRQNEAIRALQASAAARGTLNSGGFAREALRYASDLASQEYQNIYNRVAEIAGYGTQATANSTSALNTSGTNAINLATQGGQAAASGYVAQGNITANLLNSISDSLGGIDWSKVATPFKP